MRQAADLDVAGRTVLVRSDFNVPLAGTAITDDGRIRAGLPTLTGRLGRGARVLVCAHLGRPAGDGYAARAAGGPSLAPVAARLGELLGQPVPLAADVAGESARATAAALTAGQAAMLENVRFEPAETSKDDAVRGALAARLAALADLYVGDGFGALHRKHASVYDVPGLLPHAAGQLVTAELAVLSQLTTGPARPYVVVLGGAKVSDKLGVIGNLVHIADRLLICGGMAYTFLAARGHEGSHLGADAAAEVIAGPDIPPGRMGLDIGPATRDLFARKLADAKTVFWNGPPGVFEFPAFAAGTLAVAEAISHVAGLTVVGGGDSAAAVRHLGLPADAFTHISTGGGASLEYLEGRDLPGLLALEAGP